jgi:uncharacterized protein YdhG (YjbR/CyaY superfamily)
VTKDPRVDAYLATLPAEQREMLQSLRARIARSVPRAEETISYGMPAFKLNKKFLVSFAGWKSHCSIYPLTDTVAKSHEDELEGYGRTKGSLHFTQKQPLPDAVLDDLIRERVASVEAGER